MSEAGPIIVKRKKVQAAPHHGGSWKVAYADFVTAMMAFFMVMWIMGMDAETRSMIQGYFNDPLGFIKNPPKTKSAFEMPGSPAPKPGNSTRHGAAIMDEQAEQEAMRKIKRDLEKEVQSDPDLQSLAKNVEITVTPEGLRIELLEATGSLFFESGKAAILPKAMALIRKIAPILVRSGRKMVVEGHTDAAPYPSATYTNWDLSTDRASSLRRALSSSGLPIGRFSQVRGYADTQLKSREDPYHFSNRRVTILLPMQSASPDGVNPPADALSTQIKAAFRNPVDIAPGGAKVKG